MWESVCDMDPDMQPVETWGMAKEAPPGYGMIAIIIFLCAASAPRPHCHRPVKPHTQPMAVSCCACSGSVRCMPHGNGAGRVGMHARGTCYTAAGDSVRRRGLGVQCAC